MGTLGNDTLDGLDLDPDVRAALEDARTVSSDGSDEGWQMIYNKNGLKMGRKKFNKISYMKTTIALDVPVKHGLHMMVNMEPDRAKYDDMILGGELIKTFDSAPNVKDQALTMKM